MKLRTGIWFGMVACAAGAVAGAIYFSMATARLREQAAAAAKVEAELATALANESETLAQLERRVEVGARARPSARSTAVRPAVTASASAAPAAGAAQSPAAVRARLLKDPVLQALWLRTKRAEIARDYTPLFARRGLRPELTERCMAALLKREEDSIDFEALRQSGDPEQRSAVAALAAKGKAELAATLEEVLGAEGYREFQEYGRSLGPRRFAGQLYGNAVLGGEPMTAAQIEGVAMALADASARYRQGGSAQFSDLDWNVADERVRAILTPRQFAVYLNGDRAALRLMGILGQAVAAEHQ